MKLLMLVSFEEFNKDLIVNVKISELRNEAEEETKEKLVHLGSADGGENTNLCQI